MTASEYAAAGEAETREFVGGFAGSEEAGAGGTGQAGAAGSASDGRLPGDPGVSAAAPADLLSPPEGMRDVDGELAAPPRARLPRLTLLLAAGVLLAGGFFAGVKADRWQNGGGSDAGRGTAAAGAARPDGAVPGQSSAGQEQNAGSAGGSGSGRQNATGPGTTAGTVKLVDGSTVYVTDASGTIVKVTTNADTKIRIARDGKPADLKPGDTVVVRGEAGDDGTLAAATVTQGQTGAGFAGGTGGGTGAGGGTGTGPGAAGGSGQR